MTGEVVNATVTGLPETASTFNPIRMTVSPTEGYDIREVSFTVNGGEKQILTADHGIYTIPGSRITGDLAVTVIASESFTVSFDGNGGSGSMQDITHQASGEYTLPACTFDAPTDSRFKGWQVNGDTSRIYQTHEKITITGNTVLTAVWKKIDYVNVTLKAGSGSGEDQISRVERHTEFTFPRCTFTAPAVGTGIEMDFAGWAVGGTDHRRSGDYRCMEGYAGRSGTGGSDALDRRKQDEAHGRCCHEPWGNREGSRGAGTGRRKNTEAHRIENQ